ncbi:uncharacterized protein N7515_009232 [Penicillium bovifimosum]|uniref:Uncharacterized protein n=1 Tax=Penicillium bovifimosum TaxID=126998 RepID=A0A9W9GJA9_9EURO|nr:uncharacterized protein N7515_009232 [Penicillium bovifimosum]KAJ5121271.1 hypothetical protein N7515_009232 [Penicillium bovifimosum]
MSHLVFCFEPPSPEFYDEVHRQTTYPFWKCEQLVLRPEYKALATIPIAEVAEPNVSGIESESDSDFGQNDDESEPEGEPVDVLAIGTENAVQEFLDLIKQERANGNAI